MRAAPVLFLALLVTLGAARGDEVVLKDGTRLTGEVVSMDPRRVVLSVTLGGGRGELTLERAQVASVSLDERGTGAPPPDAPAPESGAPASPMDDPLAPPAAEPAPAPPAARTREGRRGATEPGTRARPRPGEKGARTLFLLDRSGSMAIGGRWRKATGWLCDRLQTLEKSSEVDVLFFDERVDALYGAWREVTDHMRGHMDDVLASYEPAMRSGTNVDRALRGALERDCDRIVLITDGVVTRGGTDGMARALERTLEATKERNIRLDVVAVQDGAFHAPVEDLAAARTLLERLSRSGRGLFTPLPGSDDAPPPPSYIPTPGAGPAHEPRVTIELADCESRNTIVPRVLRPFPKFRARVRDEVLLRGDTLDVWEYGGIAWLEVRTIDPVSGLELDQVERIELVREGEWLTAELPIQLVGTEDHRYRSNRDTRREGKVTGNLGPPQTRIDDRYATCQATDGCAFEVVYHRGAETFTDRRFLRASAAEVTVIGNPTGTRVQNGPAGR